MGTSTGVGNFRAPVFLFFGVRGLHLCGLRFFFFSGSGFCISRHPRFVSFRALVFLFFGVRGLHLCGLRFFFFSGSSFCISQHPRCVSFQAPLFVFFGLHFLHLLVSEVCIFAGSAFALFGLWFLLFSAPEVCFISCSSFYTQSFQNRHRTRGPCIGNTNEHLYVPAKASLFVFCNLSTYIERVGERPQGPSPKNQQ